MLLLNLVLQWIIVLKHKLLQSCLRIYISIKKSIHTLTSLCCWHPNLKLGFQETKHPSFSFLVGEVNHSLSSNPNFEIKLAQWQTKSSCVGKLYIITFIWCLVCLYCASPYNLSGIFFMMYQRHHLCRTLKNTNWITFLITLHWSVTMSLWAL